MYPLGNIWAAGRLRNTESRKNDLSLNTNLTHPITPVTYSMKRYSMTAVYLQSHSGYLLYLPPPFVSKTMFSIKCPVKKQKLT